jgi:transcriptional regulator with XRE-family HTH domain
MQNCMVGSTVPGTEAGVYALVVGSVIAQLREEHGLRQAELAARVGTTQSTLSRIEHGQSEPGPFLFGRLAEELDLEADELSRLVRDAHARTAEAASHTLRDAPKAPWWESALKVAGVVGLAGLAAFAVAAVLSEKKEKSGNRRKP